MFNLLVHIALWREWMGRHVPVVIIVLADLFSRLRVILVPIMPNHLSPVNQIVKIVQLETIVHHVECMNLFYVPMDIIVSKQV